MKITRQLITNTLVIVVVCIVGYFVVRRAEGFEVPMAQPTPYEFYTLEKCARNLGSDKFKNAKLKDIELYVWNTESPIGWKQVNPRGAFSGDSTRINLMVGDKFVCKSCPNTIKSRINLPTNIVTGNGISANAPIVLTNLNSENLGALTTVKGPKEQDVQIKVKFIFTN